MNSGLGSESSRPLSCYNCGHNYWFLGKNRHPGQCPRCRSRLVTPASEIRIITSQTADADGDAVVQLTGTDDSGRLFQYWFRTEPGHEAVCTRVDVCGDSLSLDVDGDWPLELFSPSVEDAAERAGLSIEANQ